jgi:hypothetical protein
MRFRVCYLDCHEAGLCCYLVIDIENILPPFVTYLLTQPLVKFVSVLFVPCGTHAEDFVRPRDVSEGQRKAVGAVKRISQEQLTHLSLRCGL